MAHTQYQHPGAVSKSGTWVAGNVLYGGDANGAIAADPSFTRVSAGVYSLTTLTATTSLVVGSGNESCTIAVTGTTIARESAATNSVLDALTLTRNVSGGNGAAGAGVGISLKVENGSGNLSELGRINSRQVTATAGSEDGALDFYTRQAGTTAVSWAMVGGNASTGFFSRNTSNTYQAGSVGSSALSLYSGTTSAVTVAVALNLTTVASATSATLKGVSIPARTYTVTGTTQITTATGFNVIEVGTQTITDSSACTIDHSATLYIAGAPVAAGSAVITNPYALWVDSGVVRIDNATANGSATVTISNVAPAGVTTATIAEWLTINIGGNVRYIPCWGA